MLPVIHLHDLQIYTYPLILGIALSASWNFIKYFNLKYNETKISKFELIKLFMILIPLMYLGAKLFFLLTQNQFNSIKLGQSANFWLGGGLVFYGGQITLLVGLTFISSIFKFKYQKDKLIFRNSIILALILAHGIGRIACFVSGCCFGHLLENGFRIPVQLIEAIFLFLMFYYFFKNNRDQKSLLFKYVIFYGGFRFIIEFLRADLIRGEYYSLSSSQWISLILIFVFLLGNKFWARKIS